MIRFAYDSILAGREYMVRRLEGEGNVDLGHIARTLSRSRLG